MDAAAVVRGGFGEIIETAKSVSKGLELSRSIPI
jgi:hypothetical protein